MKRKLIFILTLVLVAAFFISAFTKKDLPINREEPSANIEFGATNLVADTPTVFMTSDISSNGLLAVYHALGRKAEGKVAVKVHTGEPGGHYFLSPALIKELVQTVNGTIVESNTAYGGSRASTAMHKQVAIDHGFTAIAPVDILDEQGYTPLSVPKGNRIKQDFVGSHLTNYNFLIVLSHFKGHAMGGFGGAIKNMSIGIASTAGKCWIHSSGNSMTSPWGGAQDPFLESMAEAASAVAGNFGDKIMYISVMNNLSVDCDCSSNPAAPTMKDIGILASLDAVALDQACVDLVYAAPDGRNLIQRMESRNGIHTVEHGAAIGFGSRTYKLKNVSLTSMEEKEVPSVFIYPNPANSAVHIPNHTNYDFISIFDMNGREVAKYKSESALSVQSINQGMYVVQFKNKGKVIGVSTLLKRE
jgi:uncharacterized protein